MNKGLVVGISIAILLILGGIFYMSTDTSTLDTTITESDNFEDIEPKRYTQSLSESVSLDTP